MKISNYKKKICRDIIDSSKSFHLISAGAGTGKTSLLKFLVNKILKDSPRAKILFVGFANVTIMGGASKLKHSGNIDYRTIHQVGLEIIRKNPNALIKTDQLEICAYSLPYNIPETPVIICEGNEFVDQYDIGKERNVKPKTIINHLDRCYREKKWVDPNNDDISETIKEYARLKKKEGAIDYRDMILVPCWLLNDSGSNTKFQSYDYIICDEGQDINSYQMDILLGIKGGDCKMIIVGDPCQYAYGFLGATPDFFKRVEKSNLKDVVNYTLAINRRCPDTMCALSNAITEQITFSHKTKIKPSKRKMGGVLPQLISNSGMDEQVDFVCKKICDLLAACYKESDIVILFRVINDQNSRQVFAKLKKKLKELKIRFAYKDRYIQESFKYELFYAAIRVSMSDYDDYHLISTLTLLKNIGVIRAEGITENLNQSKNASSLVKILQKKKKSFRLKIRYVAKICQKYADVDEDVLKFFIEFLDYKEMKKKWRKRLRERLLPKDAVTISTIHSFKGAESKVVFVMGVDKYNFPFHQKSLLSEKYLNEEKSLLNIAITRAEEQLYLIYKRSLTGREELSEFLSNKNVRELIEEVRFT